MNLEATTPAAARCGIHLTYFFCFFFSFFSFDHGAKNYDNMLLTSKFLGIVNLNLQFVFLVLCVYILILCVCMCVRARVRKNVRKNVRKLLKILNRYVYLT